MARANKNMEITKILSELYLLDPSLKEHEAELIDLIQQMSDLKSETKFDKRFAARLKREILQKNNVYKINFNFMNKKIYFVASSAAVLGIVIIFIGLNYDFSKKGNQGLSKLDNNYQVINNDKASKQVAFVKLKDGAYGSLASLNTAGNSISAKTAAPLGLGGGGGQEMASVAPTLDTNMVAATQGVAGSADNLKITEGLNL